MTKFRVTFTNGDTEEIEADRVKPIDEGRWVLFACGLDSPIAILRPERLLRVDRVVE